MNGILIDSCVLLDLFTDDPIWANWSENVLDKYSQTNTLYINSIVYTEISIGFNKIEEVERAISKYSTINVIEIPREALFLAGKVFLNHKIMVQKHLPCPISLLVHTHLYRILI